MLGSCTIQSYSQTVSMAELVSEKGSRLHNVVQFHIHFSELQQIKYTERTALDVYAVVSDIGGAMGIFLGASLVSLIDLIASVYKVICKIVAKISGKTDEMALETEPCHHQMNECITGKSFKRTNDNMEIGKL